MVSVRCPKCEAEVQDRAGACPECELPRERFRTKTFAQELSPEDSIPFREHGWLVDQAKLRPPREPMATVSSFSGWVFDLSHPEGHRDPTALAMGKAGESLIEKRRKLKLARGQAPSSANFRLLFADPLDDSAPSFQISCLTLNGKPLRGRPDVVLEDKITGEVSIFERKVTNWRRDVPATGWPNLKVQLWCYGWIDQWRDAPEVSLIGQIWKSHNETLDLSRKIPRWERSDPQFHKECEELFNLFGGHFHPTPKRDPQKPRLVVRPHDRDRG